MVPSVARMAGRRVPLGHQGPGGLPDHVEDGDADLLLDAVHEVVGGVAGDGDDGAAALLQQAGVGQQALVHRLGVPGEDGGGPVRDPGVRQDQGGQMLLVAGGLCPVQHVLIEHLGGLGPSPPGTPSLGSRGSLAPLAPRVLTVDMASLQSAQFSGTLLWRSKRTMLPMWVFHTRQMRAGV